MRMVSFAPKTRVEASAVSPLAIRKLRRVVGMFRRPSTLVLEMMMLSSFEFSARLGMGWFLSAKLFADAGAILYALERYAD
jgi:hypothetical protein